MRSEQSVCSAEWFPHTHNQNKQHCFLSLTKHYSHKEIPCNGFVDLRVLSALLLVAGLTIVLVYYMVCLGAILTTCLNAEQIFPYYPMLHQLPLLHWLPISFRINFKILLLAFKAIHELAPSYIQMILLKLSLSTQDIDCDLTTEHCCLIRFLNFDNPRQPGFRCYGDLTLELCTSGNKNGQIS